MTMIMTMIKIVYVHDLSVITFMMLICPFCVCVGVCVCKSTCIYVYVFTRVYVTYTVPILF